jgi:hypothetical protein
MKNNSVVAAILLVFLISLLSTSSRIGGTNRPNSMQQDHAPARHHQAIAFELYDNFVFIQVRVDGSEPRSFLLDTGANVSFLNQTLANSLRIEVKHQHESNIGTGETSTRLGFSKSVTLSLSGVDVPAKSVAVVPLGDLESTVGRPIDGILGADLFKRFVVTIDYAARNIILENPKLYSYHGNGELIPIRLSGDRPFVRATVTPVGSNPIEGLFVVDTGDDSTLGLHTPFVEKYKLRSLNQRMIPHLSHGISGDSRNWRGRVAGFQLGMFKIDHPVATFAEAAKGSDADRSYDGVLGGEILRRFKVTLDYSRRQMILEPNAGFAEAYDFDMSGLSLSVQGQDFEIIKVSHVQSDSPAFEAGLKEGDIIETIDSKPAADFGLQHIELMFKQDGQEYRVGVKRGDALIQFRMKVRRLI